MSIYTNNIKQRFKVNEPEKLTFNHWREYIIKTYLAFPIQYDEYMQFEFDKCFEKTKIYTYKTLIPEDSFQIYNFICNCPKNEFLVVLQTTIDIVKNDYPELFLGFQTSQADPSESWLRWQSFEKDFHNKKIYYNLDFTINTRNEQIEFIKSSNEIEKEKRNFKTLRDSKIIHTYKLIINERWEVDKYPTNNDSRVDALRKFHALVSDLLDLSGNKNFRLHLLQNPQNRESKLLDLGDNSSIKNLLNLLVREIHHGSTRTEISEDEYLFLWDQYHTLFTIFQKKLNK